MTRVMAVRRPVPRSPGSVGPQGPLHGRHRGVRISRTQPPAQGFTRNDLGPDHPAKDRRKRDLPHAAWPFDPSSGPVRQGPGTDQPDALKQEQRFTPINCRPASRLAKRLMPDRAARPRSNDIRRPTIGPFIEPATQQFIDAIANQPPVESLPPPWRVPLLSKCNRLRSAGRARTSTMAFCQPAPTGSVRCGLSARGVSPIRFPWSCIFTAEAGCAVALTRMTGWRGRSRWAPAFA